MSSRSFNEYLANTLLVLIDGGSVYTPLFCRVYWKALETMVKDIDQIRGYSRPWRPGRGGQRG